MGFDVVFAFSALVKASVTDQCAPEMDTIKRCIEWMTVYADVERSLPPVRLCCPAKMPQVQWPHLQSHEINMDIFVRVCLESFELVVQGYFYRCTHQRCRKHGLLPKEIATLMSVWLTLKKMRTLEFT